MKKTINGVVLRRYMDSWKAVIDDVPVVFYPVKFSKRVEWRCKPRPAFYQTKEIAHERTLTDAVLVAVATIEADL